ncbi:ABC transporter permease [Sagittula sp. SSi028]|uniref:ABC transporter permease n=1 Tax=Sagittula sp. SSi028 TaxID=3400636 RepID=UPI003AF5DC7B
MSQGPANGRLLRAIVLAVVAAGLLTPIMAGLWQTARAGFGVLPVIGATEPSLAPLQVFLSQPGLWASLRATLISGIGSSVLALGLAVGLAAVAQRRLQAGLGARLLVPFLATPHAAVAIGLAFVLAPSGWIARLIAPVMGLTAPPGIASVGDPYGIALMVGLTLKEMPFLLLMILSALGQIRLRQTMAVGRSLGYGRGLVWIKVILPQIWPLIRLPMLVVIAYALSVVDMALILGPSNPPTLAVMLMRLFSDPDIAMLLPASAGALVQLVLVVAAFGALWLVERALRPIGLWWLRRGGRGASAEPGLKAAAAAATALFGLGVAGFAALAVWSLAWRWSWPHILPQSWSTKAWLRGSDGWLEALGTTLGLALTTTALALIVTIAWLEGEDRAGRGRATWAEALVYLPLLLPQIGFLYGLNILFLRTGVMIHFWAVVWAQTLFVFPYVMIAMTGPWRALDPHLVRAAGALGAGPWRRLFAVKLPVLLRPILTAAAVGVAVSVAQYLPTLFMGAGRVATLTTEAVALSSGSDRRITAVYAVLQALVPLAGYALAFAIPAVAHHNRRALKGNDT